MYRLTVFTASMLGLCVPAYSQSVTYYWAFPGKGWNSAQIGGAGTTISSTAIAVRSSDEADVVAEGPGNTLMYYWAFPGKGWNSTQIAGAGTTISSPAIAVRSSG